MPAVESRQKSVPNNAEPNPPAWISLEIQQNINEPIRSRISYAFRIFAAIYNYKVCDPDPSSKALRCFYTETPPASPDPSIFYIPARYLGGRVSSKNDPLTVHSYANENVYLWHGVDPSTGNPDWLGEIFVWLSCGHEVISTKRDSVGRVPYSETAFAEFEITPRKPYAAILMAWMENALRNGNTVEALAKAPCPIKNADHIVLPSHDIDYTYTTKSSAAVRLFKNLVIACRMYRNASFFCDNLLMLLKLIRGDRIGDYLPALIQKMEAMGFRSTFFAVARHGHRRDPDYRLDEIAASLNDVNRKGFSVNLHGSYKSIVEDSSLRIEAEALELAVGKYPTGSRQHWLRFGSQDSLFRETERAAFHFDSSIGFPEKVGFRSGASFPYPPYDFEKEAPFSFLEFPLVLMDGGLEAECRGSGENPQAVADKILHESRTWGWGGISIVWHNPIDPIQVPDKINQVFWNCAKKRTEFQEEWMSTDQFLPVCLHRFQNAGLLKGISLDA
ncbi:MAG TPA: hypothetical protein VK709_03295 [Candidatus Saccharimonadales bacterium]|jgi:hypothetical protein|nr:hypothetical protein [Candidatus Saccharimonadales bacterium]